MFKWLKERWRRRQRRIDIEMLWPAIRDEARRQDRPLYDAHRAFKCHAYIDPAWNYLTNKEIDRIIDELT